MKPWEERFVKEETELRERAGKLRAMLEKLSRGELDFEPTCPPQLLWEQLWVMERYDETLRERAQIEKVPLPD